MTPQQIRRARRVLDELERFDHKPKAYLLIRELRGLLEPGPTLKEIFDLVPGDTLKSKAGLVGITPQAYYKLINGLARPRAATLRQLSSLSGVPIETIKASGPGP